ncbi:MAG TPA: hypothetical protein VH475_16290 [Tepidisphaeraceae bacterium]|jgi:hypothetical protein
MKSAPPNGKSAQAAPAVVAAGGGRASPTGGSVDRDRGSIDKDKGSIDKGSIDKRSIDKGSMDKGSVDKGGRKKKKPMTAEQQKQLLVIGLAAAVVLAVGASIYAYFNYIAKPKGPPRLNEPTAVIAPFVATNEFDKLPWDRQRLYIKELSGKRKDLEDDYKSGRLSKNQLEESLALVWLGKQFKHIDEYYSLGELDKKAFIDKLIDKDLADRARNGGKADTDEVDRDKKKVKSIVEKFPDAERRAYDGYRRALKDREKQRDKEAKAAAKAGKSTSRPSSSRPAGESNNTGSGAKSLGKSK